MPVREHRPWLLVSDIDDTLTGDPAAMVTLANAIRAEPGRLWFAVNSSRPRASVEQTLARDFPPGLSPDAIITALGTEISVRGVPLPDWEARFNGWPQAEILARLKALGHRQHDAAFQTSRKVSFAVPPGTQDAARAALADLPCQIIASGPDDFDVIPPDAGKDAATLHLARSLGIAADNLVVAGDSGNDLAMFGVTQRAIAVHNARSELLDRLSPGSFFHASRPHAAGVLEGLRHYGVLLAADRTDT